MGMNFSVSKSALSKVISFTECFVPSKPTQPILSNFYLVAGDGTLTISASDTENGAVAVCKADVKTPGRTTVKAKMFADVIRELPEAQIDISCGDGEKISISCLNSKLTITGHPASEYPAIKALAFNPKMKIRANEIVDIINKTSYAAATNDTNFALNGVFIQSVKISGKSVVRALATDGHRMALLTKGIEGIGLPESGIIVPKSALIELKKIVADEGEKDVNIDVSEGYFVVGTSVAKVAIRLIDGDYPDFSRVIEKRKEDEMVVSTELLAQALRRSSLMVTDNNNSTRFDLSDGRLRLTSRSPESGEAVEELEVSYSGKAVSIGFNASYILDAINCYSGSQSVVIATAGSDGFGKIMAESDEASFGIVMPMRVV
jgi:DNA polymerase-3 subunit beta